MDSDYTPWLTRFAQTCFIAGGVVWLALVAAVAFYLHWIAGVIVLWLGAPLFSVWSQQFRRQPPSQADAP